MSDTIPPYSTLSPQATEVYNRLNLLESICESCVDCYDHCPAYAVCNCGHDSANDSMIRARLGSPDDWTREDKERIARRLMHDE